MKINIPCDTCGCQECDATTNNGEKVKISICRCSDGSGQFDVSIEPYDGSEIIYETHQCSKSDIEDCLNNRYNVDLNSMSHECFN
jgi:hypothetical protein